jgi:hypothetical protein
MPSGRFWRGANAGEGGFDISMAFSFNTVQTSHRFFVGLYGTVGDPCLGGDPSSRVNLIGIGQDAGDSTLQLMHNDNAGSAPKTNTTLTLTAGIVYVLRLTCAGGGADVVAELFTRIQTTLTSVYGPVTVSTELPVATTMMLLVLFANTGAQTTQGTICFHEWGVLT